MSIWNQLVTNQWKKYIFGHRRESFRHLSSDNSELDVNSVSVKVLLVMGVVEIFCVCNSGVWKLMTTPVSIVQWQLWLSTWFSESRNTAISFLILIFPHLLLCPKSLYWLRETQVMFEAIARWLRRIHRSGVLRSSFQPKQISLIYIPLVFSLGLSTHV